MKPRSAWPSAVSRRRSTGGAYAARARRSGGSNLTVIYTITAFKLVRATEQDEFTIKHHRTWGWVAERGEARRIILDNEGDLFEDGYYNFALIEEVQAGAWAETRAVAWFEAVYTKGSRTPAISWYGAQSPPGLAGTCNFSMG